MGEVWRARDDRLNRTVAVKILPPDVSNDPTRRARFEREAKALAALNHPNIVAVYDTGAEEGKSYIVSELVEGESLRALIDRGRVPVRKVVDLAVQIAEAMAAAHGAGIIHRDLKPENIMLTPGGRVKVLDFGLAKHAEAAPRDAPEKTATMALSQPGLVMGTVGYMSPEQVRGENTDHRSDIFSFGAVLYEMITCKRAFQGPTSVETMHAILHDEPGELESSATSAASLPPSLGVIIRRCLEKRPDDRFQSAADLAFALRSVSPSSFSGSQTALAPVGPARSAKRWIWPLAVVLAAGVIFGAGFYLRDRTINRDPPRFQRITFRTGLVSNAQFTGDGRNIIYSAKWDGGPARVYFATPGTPDSRDLELPNNSLLASVSANDQIAFFMGPYLPDGSGTLSRSAINGGQMRPWLNGVFSADWMADGSSVAIQRFVDGKFRIESPIGKVLLDNLRYPVFGMRVSPDGKQIVFAHFHEGSSLALSVVDNTGKRRFLASVSDQTPNRIDTALAWSANGREVWYRSFDSKEWGTIYAMDMEGKRRVVTRMPGHAVIYDIARDGRALVRTDRREVGILGLAPGATEERELSCLDNSTLSGISDDGRMIAATVLGESGGPKGSVYLRKTDGTPPVRVGDGTAVHLSPDGNWVAAYTSLDALSRRYTLLPTGAGEEHELAIADLGKVNVVFGWSEDGQTLYLLGPAKGQEHKWRHYAWNSRAATLRPIGPDTLEDRIGFTSPDRRQVLARGADLQWIIYPVAGGPIRPVRGLSEHDIPIGWRADNHSLYIVTHHDESKSIPVSILDPETGKTIPWKDIHPGRPVEQVLNLAVTPDGRSYAYNFIVKTTELYVVDGLR